MASLIIDIEVYDKEKAEKEHGWGHAQFSSGAGIAEHQYDTMVKVLIKAIETIERNRMKKFGSAQPILNEEIKKEATQNWSEEDSKELAEENSDLK